MANRIPAACVVAIATLAPVLFPGHVLAAQGEQDSPEGRPWQVALWLKGGYHASEGTVANNSPSDIPGLGLLETIAEMNSALVYGGGVEVRFPAEELTVRLGWESLSGAEIAGRIGICSVAAGDLCDPVVAPADVWTVSSLVRVVSGNPDAEVRPVIRAGVGLRGFAYPTVPECPDRSAGAIALVCSAIVDIYEDPGVQLRLRLGLGLQATVGRFVLEAAGDVATGRYNGGSERTNGNWYHDLRAELSTSTLIFR